jgi:hypothetical protein
MEKRVRFLEHRGKQILLVDLSHLKAAEILELLPDIQEIVTSEPRNSVLSLGDYTDTEVRREVADQIKKTLVFDRPHVKKSALVGTDHVPHVFLEAFHTFAQRDFGLFQTREEAMDWLVADTEGAEHS